MTAPLDVANLAGKLAAPAAGTLAGTTTTRAADYSKYRPEAFADNPFAKTLNASADAITRAAGLPVEAGAHQLGEAWTALGYYLAGVGAGDGDVHPGITATIATAGYGGSVYVALKERKKTASKPATAAPAETSPMAPAAPPG